MNRWTALALALAMMAALALRLPNLDARPFHNDEAVNGIKVTELWLNGNYKYDPDEYHGPTLHYATLPFLWLSGAKDAGEVGDGMLRWVTVAFGVGLILLLPQFLGGISKSAVGWAALFLAVSPAMVFYSRYFIHEMLLVFFSALTLGAGWRCAERPSAGRAILAGAGFGLMFATKETFVLSAAAMGAGLVGTTYISRRTTGSSDYLRAFMARWAPYALSFAAAALVIWILFFTSFFSNWNGLSDSVKTYFPWLKRAGGHSPHIHPWYFYFERLAWFHPVKGPVWSEAFILCLAVVGTGAAIVKKSPLQIFLVLYTGFLTLAYTAISYKTPWCLLNFYFGMILLAGIGAATLLESFQARALKAVAVVVVVALSGQLAWQSWQAGTRYAADRRNPYVYAQTSADLLNLVQKVHAIARVGPRGDDTIIKVIAPESDYWPLPWYLRRFRNIGWYEKVPEDPYAPIVIAASQFDARLDEKSEKKWIMAGLTELRPKNFLELYVELELWKKYVETLPRNRE